MDQSIEQMYKDALTVTKLQEVLRCSDEGDMYGMHRRWDEASAMISGLLPRVAVEDMNSGNALMRLWKQAREAGTDPRRLAGLIDGGLIGTVRDCLGLLYGEISFSIGPWLFAKKGFGFLTASHSTDGLFLHDPYDPMREAVNLAHKLYQPEMESFHILGCGLGYLAWQIRELSGHTTKIYIYEDDMLMLQAAREVGVLSWIDPEGLVLANNSDRERMLQMFLSGVDTALPDHFVSDWKVHAYNDTKYGSRIEALDFNGRTKRRLDEEERINRRVNAGRPTQPVELLRQDEELAGRSCVLVSAGPSLNENIGFLKESKGRRTIIAVNTAVKRLEKEGIRPDIIVMLDPLPLLIAHIEGIEDFTEGIPLVSLGSGSRDYIARYRGPVYMIDDSDYPWDFGGTVASLGLDLAFFLGAGEVFLIGSDLAFPGGMNYAGGLSNNIHKGVEESIETEAADGGKVATNLLYDTYRKILEEQIAAHPERKVYNLSRHGALIRGAEPYPPE